MLKLQFRDRRQEAVWLVDQTFTIGKNPSNSLMIDDETIQDFHAEISNTFGQLSISSKSPSSSLWVNNKLVEKLTTLNAEDVIKLGSIELELIDPKTLLNKTKTKKIANNNLGSSWVIHSKASWLEQKIFPIEGKAVIGRDAECDITLPLEHLSRKHLELEVRRGHLFIKDLNSSNGTFLNGQKITESEIKPGDKIKLDVLTFEVSGPSHDSNKTIIRTAPAKNAPKKQTSSSSAPKETTTNRKPVKNKQQSKLAPTKKRLASNGKQDWISDKAQKEKPKRNKTSLILFMTTIIILGIMGVYFAP
ncbi:MAG: pSer/pThr/pTyr-binding forkhead associated (FHA) protein [Oleiphilaceae bacterium]|jgi:pSer/pThr/pTyr-binding forkhead associated (FHA) protein